MKRFFIAAILLVAPLHAQNWSGILSSTRATDWSNVGVEGGIPSGGWANCTTASCNTLFGGTVTATSIQNALSSAPANSVVRIPAGTYTISGSGITFNESNVVLRGAGADQTILKSTSNSSGCHLFYSSSILFCAGSGNIGVDSPSHTANWTAGYAQGTTVITLSSTTGLAVGSTIFLDQNDDASDGWPAAGDLFVCAAASSCSDQGGGDNFARSGRSSTMLAKVTNISGSNVTISPGVTFPNYRSGQSPGAWWGDSSLIISNSGIENLTLDFSGNGGGPGIEMVNATNCWVTGVRAIFTGGPGSFIFHVLMVNAFHTTIANDYFYGPNVQGNTQYQIAPHVSGSLLIQNNIHQEVVSGIVPNGPFSNSVIAYNFVTASFYTGPGAILHNSGEMMNLWEGNNTSGFIGDIIHGTHFMDTLFRNHFDGHKNNPPANTNGGIQLNSHNRFFNIVGNVIGDSYFDTYETDNAQGDTSIYIFGWLGDGSGGGTPGNDSNVARTVMRWGNWDKVTNAVRWCGNSSDTGWATTCSSTTEVPSGITNFPATLPTLGDTGAGQSAMPASFYLNSKPSWFGSVAWPPVGPDVSGGNVTGYAGHANEIPSRLCYESLTNDPSYPSSSPRIKTFNAGACYTGGVATAPTFNPSAPYTGVSVSVTINDTNSGTHVTCYTTNGTTPATAGNGTSCTTGAIYFSPLSISSTTTLKAISGTSTLTDSTVTSGVYTTIVVPAPVGAFMATVKITGTVVSK